MRLIDADALREEFVRTVNENANPFWLIDAAPTVSTTTTDETHNGWTGKGTKASAYATWRVHLELVADYADDLPEEYDEKPDQHDLADHIQDYVVEAVAGDDYEWDQLATQYAMAFLATVNWGEIAEGILADWPSS